ncbi:MAG: C1 family peptidase [Verrucomicrobiales bacterium]|nr:C1 family peptidase [Verrucomicrobiales bacterium]
MIRIAFVFAFSILLFDLMNSRHASAQPGPEGALTPEWIENLQDSFELNEEDRARFNAITNSDINSLALNREIVRGEDGHFSHRIKGKGITNQKASGRCWMFAGFNAMRPRVIHEMGMEEFEFSAAFLLFWDKMEKSNLYLEQVIELRDVDRLDREWELINEAMVGDGGWWNYVTSLIEKYGTVPSTVMPETHSSENTRTMNVVLARLLRSRAAVILEASEAGANVAELRKRKSDAMSEVYRFLVLNLGEPPREFEWRFKRKKKGEEKENGEEENKSQEMPGPMDETLTDRKSYTPKSFYEDFVGVDLSEYVALYHDPAQPTGRHYEFSRARNIVGQPDMNFVNIEMEDLKEIAVKSILANEPPWFAVNMGVDQSREHGLMENDLFDYETLFGMEMPFSKADRSRFLSGASNHAMVLMGVDLIDGKPAKWLVENSWGDDKGNKGTWTLYDGWFDEHVYNVIAHKKYVSPEILEIFEEEAESLPAWYPGAQGIRLR